jgi:NAD(P)-dependent dehydrogenase (short-subunit alcohol dehydrogenase family)
MRDFEGRVAAITGAGSGIGQALALELVQRGCAVALCDVRPQGLDATAAMIGDSRVAVSLHQVDVADRAAVERFAAETVRRHGAVNLVFNNAGVSVTADVERLDYDDFEWLMRVNFWGVVHGTKAFLPYLHRTDAAHIVNTASIFGVIAVPGQAAYNASKFAVRGFTEALRQELAGTHIGVSCVLPGGVRTNIVRTSRYYPRDNAAPTREEFEQRFDALARLTPGEAARTILRGVQKNRGRILVGRDAKTIALFQRLLPERYPALLRGLLGIDGSREAQRPRESSG